MEGTHALTPGGPDRPAAVVNFVDPCYIGNAFDVLAAFQEEVYPALDPGAPERFRVRPSAPGCARALPGAPERFRVQFSHWSPFGTVAAAVFPSGGVERLAQLCAANGLILVRGVLTAITPRTKGRAALDTAAVTKDISATAPDEKDVYTFLPRTNPAAPLIVCGAHEWDLPPALRGEGG